MEVKSLEASSSSPPLWSLSSERPAESKPLSASARERLLLVLERSLREALASAPLAPLRVLWPLEEDENGEQRRLP